MPALDAILRQLAHYTFHAGQLVALCKQHCATWHLTSIPKGESNAYTAAMLSGGRLITGG